MVIKLIVKIKIQRWRNNSVGKVPANKELDIVVCTCDSSTRGITPNVNHWLRACMCINMFPSTRENMHMYTFLYRMLKNAVALLF